MKIKSDVIWAALLICTAAISIFLGARGGTIQTEETLKREIDQKNEKIKILENKIQQLSEELTSRGIYSYPHANLVSTKNKNISVVITLNGRDAIEDLEIQRKIIPRDPKDPEKFSNTGKIEKSVSIGTLNAHNPVNFEIENFKKEIFIELIYKSKDNQWQQYIIARKTPAGEVKTFWIITNSDNQVIDKHIDDDFPSVANTIIMPGKDGEIKYSEIKMNSQFDFSAKK